MGGEGVSQRVRRELPADARLAGVAFDDVPEGLPGHAIAAAGREQIIGLALEQDLPARSLGEFLQGTHGFLAERDEALTIALAQDADHALVEIDLALTQV